MNDTNVSEIGSSNSVTTTAATANTATVSPDRGGTNTAHTDAITAASALVKQGLITQEQADHHLSNQGIYSNALAQVAAELPPDNGGFTNEQLKQMAAHAVEDGILSFDEVNAELKRFGLEQINTVDNRTEAAKEIDTAFPPGKPSEFTLPKLVADNDIHKPIPPETAKLLADSRGWLGDIGFTKEIGSHLAKSIHEVANQSERMTDVERELWQISEHKSLERMYGDQLPAKIALARQLVQEAEAKRPGLVDLLERRGGGSSALVIGHFINQAERLYQRKEPDKV